MKMNFDLSPSRLGTDSVKWDCTASEFRLTPGEDLIPMWVADMDFFCAPEILDAVKHATAPGVLGYRTLASRFDEAVIHWMQSRHGLSVSADEILPSPGVVAGISAAISVFTEPGDGVIVQPPIYPPFVGVPKGMGRVIRENKLIERYCDGVLSYDIDFEDLRRLAAEPRTKMMILCSPHNPTGRVYTPDELRKICTICAENDVYLISDEIHSDIMLKGNKFTPILSVAPCTDRVLQLCSPSKSFNTAGTHSAYMIVKNPEEREKLSGFWGSMHIPTSSFVSADVVEAAYGPAAYYVDELCSYLDGNMAFIRKYLQKNLPGIRLASPDSTYLLWADFRACGIPADQIFHRLCEAARVVPDPGEWFGEDYLGYMRINIATPRAVLEEAAQRIVCAMKRDLQ